MKKNYKGARKISAEAIARLAEEGKDVSRFFTNSGRMMEPIQRVNVDFAAEMLRELDEAARALNISRQAVIKTLVRDGGSKVGEGSGFIFYVALFRHFGCCESPYTLTALQLRASYLRRERESRKRQLRLT